MTAADVVPRMSRPAFSSMDSSPASFHTVIDSESSHRSTAASSPLHTQTAPFRDVRPLPRDLKAHCQIFLEEQLYLGAINLYNSVLGAGCSRRRQTSQSVYVPPPSHLAVLNTLIVHPVYTNRADRQSEEIATLALSYLRSLLEVVGPVNADLRAAFQFYSTPRWHRRTGYSTDGTLSDASQDERERDRVTGTLANENSVWSRGQDFWTTLGWAFNCSTLYPQRWRYWKPWLEFMLDVLQADWTERERLDREAHEAAGGATDGGPVPTTMRQDSILAMYMEQKNGPQGGFKAIMKALFADGGSLSTSSFREVFDREPRGRVEAIRKRKRQDRVDAENDKLGDFLDEDPFSSGASEPPTPEKPRDARSSVASFGTTFPGLAETVPLRLRLFKLLSGAMSALRKPADVTRLYDAYASSLKVVPLDLFALVVAQRRGPLPTALRVTLLKVLLALLLPASHYPPHKADPAGEAEARLTTAMLTRCYAPHPANTVGVEDNAKLSLVVEAAVQLLWTCQALEYGPALDDAVRAGIDAREAKVKRKRTGKARPDPGDTLAVEVLDASSDRLRVLLEVIRDTASEGDKRVA